MAGTITATTTSRRGQGWNARTRTVVCTITTDGSGVASATDIGPVYGRLVGIQYKPGTLDTGADLTLTDKFTGATLFSLTDAGTTARAFRPTQIITSTSSGAYAAVTAGSTAVDVNRDIFVAGTLQLAVAQGGATKTGTLTLIVKER